MVYLLAYVLYLIIKKKDIVYLIRDAKILFNTK